MKYLKSKAIFESSEVDDLLEKMREILQELSDEGIKINISKGKKPTASMRIVGFIVGENTFPDIFTYIESRQQYSFEFYLDSLHHLISFMKDSGYSVCDFNFLAKEPNTRKALSFNTVIIENSKISSRLKKEISNQEDIIPHLEQNYSDLIVRTISLNFKKN